MGKLLSGIHSVYKAADACVKVNEEASESFRICREVSQGCVMSLWLLNLFMDGDERDVSKGW